MPKFFRLEHICAYCLEFGFKPGNPNGPGQAFCRHYQEWFPNQMNPERTPAGMRGGKCKHWKQKGDKDEAK